MKLRSNRTEIVGLLTWVLSDPKHQMVRDTIQNNVMFDGNVTFKKNLKLGSVLIKMDIYPLANGDLELNIKEASISGLGIFGVVRKKAGELIVSSFNQYLPELKTWKNETGNIQVHVPNISIKQFAIAGEEILIELLV